MTDKYGFAGEVEEDTEAEAKEEAISQAQGELDEAQDELDSLENQLQDLMAEVKIAKKLIAEKQRGIDKSRRKLEKLQG